MPILLRAIFREYKGYWFKTLCTFVGIFISLSLFIVIELFSLLFQTPTIESRVNIPYTHKLVHNNGFLDHGTIKVLLKEPVFKGAIPYSEKHDYFEHPNINQHVIVRGTDRFEVFRELAKSIVNENDVDLIEFRPFDLSEAFLVINSIETGQKLTIQSTLINRPINVMTVKADIPDPVLLMDIAQFQSLYPPMNTLSGLLFKLTDSEAQDILNYITTHSLDLNLMSIKTEQLQQSKWVSSLTYNLKFLAFISLIVSTCLMIQFFRFLGKQREPQFDQLFKLGISERRIKQLFFIEIGIISVVTTALALIFAKFISQLSLGTFNQLISLFYFQLNATDIYYSGLIIIKACAATAVAFTVAYFSYFYGKQFGKHLPSVIRISLLSIVFIFLGLALIFYYPERIIVVLAAILVVAGFFGVSVGSTSFIGHFLRRIKTPKLVHFKMARDTLLKDPLSYGAIVFVIALASGLVISMTIFIHSFSWTIKSWLDTVTFHDYYIQHQSNTIQYPISLPDNINQLMDDAPDSFRFSTLYRIAFIYRGLPAQIVFRKDIHDPVYSRFVFKQKANPPFSMNDVFISEPFSLKHQLTIGDTFEINGIIRQPLRVAGITYDFVSEFGQITANNALYLNDHDHIMLHGIAVKAPPGAELDQFIVQISDAPGVVSASRESILDATMKIFNDTFAFTWFVVILTSLIAIFSLVNLLTIVCINRKNELIQLWHVGFNSNELTRVILAQISIITTVSSGLSVFIGFSLYALIVYGIQQPTFNWSIFLTIPWTFIIVAPLFVILLSLIIGLIFMRTVGHTIGKGRVNESIRY